MPHDTHKAPAQGWAVTVHADGSLSARNRERGESVELTAEEVKTLRAVFTIADAQSQESRGTLGDALWRLGDMVLAALERLLNWWRR